MCRRKPLKCLKDGEDQDRHLLDMPFSAFGMLAAEDIAKFQAKYGYLGLQFLPYHVTGCDILRAGQDKATGLQALLDHLGLAAADCVAVGDGPNDAGMLALAGRSYCMADGMKTAKAAAKAKGVVGHIGITAHLSQTFEKALKVDEIETIMFPYNIVEQQGKELIDRCAEKGKAFIDMKPLAGGAIEDGRLALRYVLSNPAVTVSIPGMAAPEELEQNVAGSANTAPLTPEEKAACQKVRDTLGTQFCRRCNYCAPCTVGIQIPSCFLFHGYLERYGLAGWAHERYDTLTVKAGACIGCGKFETRCPYNLPIRDMLKKVAQDFGE